MWGKPDAYDRVAQVLVALAALFALANGGFMLADPFAWYDAVGPVEQLAMARLGAAQAEDCGPCVEIAARGAVAIGMARETVNAALAGGLSDGPEREALEFGRALALNAPELAGVGDAIEAHHCRAVRTELAVAAATARVHPALKRGLGFGGACPAQPLQL